MHTIGGKYLCLNPVAGCASHYRALSFCAGIPNERFHKNAKKSAEFSYTRFLLRRRRRAARRAAEFIIIR